MTGPALTVVLKDETASPVVFHFEGLHPDGQPFRLSLSSPIRVQVSYELDTPNLWEVLVRDGPEMAGAGNLYGFTADAHTPEGRAVLTALGHGDRVRQTA